MTPDTAPVDPSRCPLCGKANECGAERGASTCWCYSARIPEDVLNRIPADQRDRACICEACARGDRGSASSTPTEA